MKKRPLIPLSIASGFFLVALGIYAFGYVLIQKGNTDARAGAQQIIEKTAELQRVQNARAALSSLASDEQTVQGYSVAKEDIVDFLGNLQLTGKPFGTHVDVLSVANEKGGTSGRVALALTIQGPFEGVMRTLGAIEYGPYDGVITNLTLTTSLGAASSSARLWSASTIYSVGLRSLPVSAATTTKP